MPELVTLGSVPYNPYNTSFAQFALEGLKIGQADRIHSDAMTEAANQRIAQTFEFGAKLGQQAQDNIFRQQNFEHQSDEDMFRRKMEEERLKIAQSQLRMEKERLSIAKTDAGDRHLAAAEALSFEKQTNPLRVAQMGQGLVEGQQKIQMGAIGLEGMQRNNEFDKQYSKSERELGMAKAAAEINKLYAEAQKALNYSPTIDPVYRAAAKAELDMNQQDYNSAKTRYTDLFDKYVAQNKANLGTPEGALYYRIAINAQNDALNAKFVRGANGEFTTDFAVKWSPFLEAAQKGKDSLYKYVKQHPEYKSLFTGDMNLARFDENHQFLASVLEAAASNASSLALKRHEVESGIRKILDEPISTQERVKAQAPVEAVKKSMEAINGRAPALAPGIQDPILNAVAPIMKGASSRVTGGGGNTNLQEDKSD